MSNSMKSNEKYVFSLIYCPRRCLPAEVQDKFCYDNFARRLVSPDYFDVIYSTSRLVYNMDERRICRKVEFNGIFLRLRWKLEDFDHMVGWGAV